MRRIVLLAAAFAAFSAPAWAEDVKLYRGKAPSAAELQDTMFPKDEAPRTRGLVRNLAVGKAEAPPAIAFNIQFDYDSAEIKSESRGYLDSVGEMMKMDRAKGAVLVIEGHTDARGTDEYNQALSLRRAEAVRSYLESQHGIARNRLKVVGKGRSEPLSGQDPLAAENRRVQFRRDG